ncbi:MAG: hypothetical protein AAFX08_02050 [Pseudomonadota bacterium]
MKPLGLRFCRVARRDDAEKLANALRGLGLEERALESPSDEDGFNGAIFPAAEGDEGSWVEIWPAGPNMPELVMLQIIVEDADGVAEAARNNGLDPKGPDDAHGERIYYLEGPGGLPISFQSKINDG